MTALAAASDTRVVRNYKNRVYGDYVVNSGSQIWQGALVCLEAAAEEIIPAADTAGLKCIGKAEESVLGDGTKTCRVSWGYEAVFARNAAVTAAFPGTKATVEDDNTVSEPATTTNDVVVGAITQLEGSAECWVYLEGPAAA